MPARSSLPQDDQQAIWDAAHVLDLLQAPTQIRREEPWAGWIRRRGGLSAIYAHLRELRLPKEQQDALLRLLEHPGEDVNVSAKALNIHRVTFTKYRRKLCENLAGALNEWQLGPPAAPEPEGPAEAPERGQPVLLYSPPRNVIPAQWTAFFGRQQEVEALCGMLRQPAVRLLTLTGPGGAGKTRLSIQVATELSGEFGHGVFFVPLAALRDPALVPSAIVRVLGVAEMGEQPLMETLVAYLQRRSVLLVLDNFEQILSAAPLVTELLAAAPQLKVLATSRTPLHLYGEREFDIPPLVIPDLSRSPSYEEVAQSPAVRLFVDRAQAIKHDLQLTQGNAPIIAAICHRLDGLPLAIELAAARMRQLPPELILERLSNRLELLATQFQDRPARQQTLRGTIDWSYELLEPLDQTIFSQLGVFAGGLSLQAAEHVCDRAGLEQRAGQRIDLLGRLESIVDKSMLRRDEGPDGAVRFLMLETFQDYALEQLAQRGELETLRRRHATYYLQLAEEIEPKFRGAEQALCLKLLEHEHNNLRAALRWAIERGEIALALGIVGAIWNFWLIHSHFSEAQSWIEVVLAASAGSEPLRPLRVKVLWGAGWLAFTQGNIEQARAWFGEAELLARASGDQRGTGLALHGLGSIGRLQGQYEEAIGRFEESMALFQAAGDVEHVAWTLSHLGLSRREQDKYAEATALFEQSLELFRQIGQPWPIAEALSYLGYLAAARDDYGQAKRFYEESLGIYQELGDRRCIVRTYSYLGPIALAQGDYEQAIALYTESLEYSRAMEDHWGMIWLLEQLAAVAEARGQPQRAVLLLSSAEAIRAALNISLPADRRLAHERAIAQLREQLGEAAFERGWEEGRSMTLEQVLGS